MKTKHKSILKTIRNTTLNIIISGLMLTGCEKQQHPETYRYENNNFRGITGAVWYGGLERGVTLEDSTGFIYAHDLDNDSTFDYKGGSRISEESPLAKYNSLDSLKLAYDEIMRTK